MIWTTSFQCQSRNNLSFHELVVHDFGIKTKIMRMYKNIKLHQALLILTSFTIFLLFNGKFFQANHKIDAKISHHRLRQNDVSRPFSSHSYNVSNHSIYQILSTLKYLNICLRFNLNRPHGISEWSDNCLLSDVGFPLNSLCMILFYNILIHRPQDPISFYMRSGQTPAPITDMKTLWTIAYVI